MSKAQFIRVDIANWDNSKVDIVQAPKGFSVTYEGKIPILRVMGPRGNAYFLTSAKGLTKQDTYNNNTGKFTKGVWNGTWGISFKLTDNINTIRPPPLDQPDTRSEVDKLKWKLVEIKQYIADLIKEATEGTVSDVASYKYENVEVVKMVGKREQKQTVKKMVDNSYVFMNVKVGYTHPEDCETVKLPTGEEVPVFECRSPKGKYYDTSRAEGDMKIEDPNKECSVPMRAGMDASIHCTFAQGKYHVNLYLSSLFYKRDDSLAVKGDSIEDVLVRLDRDADIFDSIPVE